MKGHIRNCFAKVEDKRNDYNDLRFNEGLIEEIINDGYEKLSIIY
jgi:hypothetical protein